MRPPPILRIAEVFPSVQGEGLRLGEPTIFLRLAGCNKRCAFCDTKYARRGGRASSSQTLIAEALRIRRRFRCRWVCLTGGEPLLQDVAGLIRGLRAEGFRVHIETNGSVRRPPSADWYSVSPKPPDYGVDSGYIKKADEVKLVVTRGLTLAAVRAVRRSFPAKTPVLLQPQSNRAWSIRRGWTLLQRALAAGLPNIRLTVQAHKIFNLP
jgi:7-carboxy-7-deazaguanine synthase